jgi:hypothetical protein
MAIDMNFENLLLEIDAEEKGTNLKSKEVKKAKVMGEEDGEMEYAHEQIMEEEGLTKNDLPTEIRKMVITFERKMRMAKAKNAPEKTFLQIQNLSTLIADKILDYLEADVDKFDDGGGIDDGGMDDGGMADDIQDGSSEVDDGIDENDYKEGGSVEIKEKSGIFGGILGGILDF